MTTSGERFWVWVYFCVPRKLSILARTNERKKSLLSKFYPLCAAFFHRVLNLGPLPSSSFTMGGRCGCFKWEQNKLEQRI